MDAMTSTQQLLSLLAKISFKLGQFKLASGSMSDYYIDCRITTLHAEGGRLSGLVFYDMISQYFPKAEAVGGLTMGADPLVSNTASASAWHHLHHHRDDGGLEGDARCVHRGICPAVHVFHAGINRATGVLRGLLARIG